MSSQRLAEHGVTWSEDGTPDGFQVGKSAALLDYAHRKEAREFAALVNRLRAQKWYRENTERARAAAQARWNVNRETMLAKMKADYHAKLGPKPLRKCAACGETFRTRRKNKTCCSSRCRDRLRSREYRRKLAEQRPPKPAPLSSLEKRLAKIAAAPPLVCAHCGREWRVTKPDQRRRRYCSDYCMERAKYLNSPRGRSVQKPHTGSVQRSVLAACADWRTHAEILGATGLSKNTVSGTLAALVASGRAETQEGPRRYRAKVGS